MLFGAMGGQLWWALAFLATHHCINILDCMLLMCLQVVNKRSLYGMGPIEGFRAITRYMSINCSFGKSQLKSHQLWQNAVTQPFARISPIFFNHKSLMPTSTPNFNMNLIIYGWGSVAMAAVCDIQVFLCDNNLIKCWLLRWTKYYKS